MPEQDPQIRAIFKGLTQVTEKIVTRVSFNVVAELVEVTPVDTGWARATWVPAIGISNDVPTPAPTTPAGVQAQRFAQEAAKAKLLGYKLDKGKVFISNNTPYIRKLNEGSSPQAPSGFVQVAIAKGVRKTLAEL